MYLTGITFIYSPFPNVQHIHRGFILVKCWQFSFKIIFIFLSKNNCKVKFSRLPLPAQSLQPTASIPVTGSSVKVVAACSNMPSQPTHLFYFLRAFSVQHLLSCGGNQFECAMELLFFCFWELCILCVVAKSEAEVQFFHLPVVYHLIVIFHIW